MSHESAREAFLEAILAEPDNEVHRLIYADWLEDHGDSEGAERLRTLPELAGVWASAGGEDNYGLWADLIIRKKIQRMRWIPPGTFEMGSPPTEVGHYSDEGPVHTVEITRGFWLADTHCTQEMWEAVMAENRSSFRGARHPVENVGWVECQDFLQRCNLELRGAKLALPTAAQWEYACRAGTTGERYHEDRDAIAWTRSNSGGGTHTVAAKKPNDFGLYDMLGNLWEWGHDGRRPYGQKKVRDPIGATHAGSNRVIRGSSWNFPEEDARAAYHLFLHDTSRGPDVGFRFLSST